MAIFDKATWHGPVPNRYPGGMGKVLGLVLHIMQSQPNQGAGAIDTIEGCDAWFHNPVSQVSAHFGTGTNGELWQWVDTADAAWAEVNGNPTWVSIENSGLSGETLLPSQVDSVAEVLAWLHQTHAVPLQVSDHPTTPGLGWHGMGGAAWGDHPDCPGVPVLAQRAEIIAKAHAIVEAATPPPVEDPEANKPLPPPADPGPALDIPAMTLKRYTVSVDTDPRGDGAKFVGLPADRIVSVVLQGSDPFDGGDRRYWVGSAHFQARDNNTLVTVTGCQPNVSVNVFIVAGG